MRCKSEIGLPLCQLSMNILCVCVYISILGTCDDKLNVMAGFRSKDVRYHIKANMFVDRYTFTSSGCSASLPIMDVYNYNYR